MAANKKGGGYGGREHKSVGVRDGQRGRAINERGVAQIGSSRGNHATERAGLLTEDIEPVRRGLRPAGSPGAIPLGNEVATNVGKGGCGTGRTLYGQSGSQGTHGPVAGTPKPQGADILSSYGPDYRGRGSR